MKRIILLMMTLLVSTNGYSQCAYLPQGVLAAWKQDRALWEGVFGYEPVMTGNYPDLVVDSYRITHLDSESFIYEAGLRVGDEVTALNSVHVTDQSLFNALLKEAENLPELVISLRRKESVRFLNGNVNLTKQCY